MSVFERMRAARDGMAQHGKLTTHTVADAYKYATDIARGMVYLHETCGIVHRDLKLRNVLLNNAGVAKVRRGCGMCSPQAGVPWTD